MVEDACFEDCIVIVCCWWPWKCQVFWMSAFMDISVGLNK